MQMQYKFEQLEKENIRLKEQLENLQKKVIEHIPAHRSQLMQMFKIITYATDLQSVPLWYKGAVREITGFKEMDLLSKFSQWEQLIHPEDLSVFQARHHMLLNSSQDAPQISEYRIISSDGQIRWVNDMAILVHDKDGQDIAIEGLVIDVTRRKDVEEEFLSRQAHLDSILNSVQDVIWSVTPDTFELIYINPAAKKVYGYPLKEINADESNRYLFMRTNQELLLENFTTLLQRGWFETEFCISLPEGEKRWLNRRAHFARDAHGVVARIDGIDTDITRRKQAEDTLKYISLHDSLTGLFNRFFFEEEMQRLDKNTFQTAGLIICDIDGLKIVNDNLGHEAGDQLLKRCAKVLKCCFNKEQVVSRIGGDEFAVLIKNCSTMELTSAIDFLHQTIADHNSCSSHPFPLSLSTGMALKSSAEVQMSEVFRQADNMMYAEKPSSHQRFHDLFQSAYR
ncbi:MAG: diguanylate cyclase [Syntrophomonas sp.]